MADFSLIARVDQIEANLRLAVDREDVHPFGTDQHHFYREPPLKEQQVAEFELRYRIKLPAGYRAFLTRVANGGARPAYGMFPLIDTSMFRREVPEDYLCTAFPHTKAYNPYEDPERKLLYQRLERGEAKQDEIDHWYRYKDAGTLVLCDEGCGHLHRLVVCGPAYGQMWWDARVNDCGFFPLGVDFLDWYERWLDDALQGGDGDWWNRYLSEQYGDS